MALRAWRAVMQQGFMIGVDQRLCGRG